MLATLDVGICVWGDQVGRYSWGTGEGTPEALCLQYCSLIKSILIRNKNISLFAPVGIIILKKKQKPKENKELKQLS